MSTTATFTEYTVKVVFRNNTCASYAPVLTLDAAMDIIDEELCQPATKTVRLIREVNGRIIVSKYSR